MSHYSQYSRSTLGSARMPNTSESIKSALEGLEDRDLVTAVEKLKVNNKRTEIECDIWYNFLHKMEPKLLRGMDKLIHYANVVASSNLPRLTSQISMLPTDIIRSESISSLASDMSSATLRKSSIAGSWLSGQLSGQRINLGMKVELSKREKERCEHQMTNFLAKSKVRRMNLRAQLEELALQLAEIKEARDIFEQTICRDGVDPLTGRVPAEKFIRYMEEWLKSADSIIEKLRLRTCTLHYKYVALRKQLATKEELGESINPVDFDVLKIQNKILIGTIDDKNIDLLKLKQKVGEVNLLVARSQRYLQKQLTQKQIIMEQIQNFYDTKSKIDKERDLVQKEVERTEKKLECIKELIKNYTVPELVEYIRLKKELDETRKDVKIWSRRTNLHKIAMTSCIKKMKRLSGETTESQAWFQPIPKTDDF